MLCCPKCKRKCVLDARRSVRMCQCGSTCTILAKLGFITSQAMRESTGTRTKTFAIGVSTTLPCTTSVTRWRGSTNATTRIFVCISHGTTSERGIAATTLPMGILFGCREFSKMMPGNGFKTCTFNPLKANCSTNVCCAVLRMLTGAADVEKADKIFVPPVAFRYV